MNAAAPSSSRSETRPRKTAVDVIEVAGLPIFFVAMVAFFLLNPATGPLFGSRANIQNLLGNQSVTGLVAVAMVIPLIAGYFDLSVAAIAGVSNVTVTAMMVTYDTPIWLAIIVALLVGLLCGAINAFLVAVLKLNAFIATLGMFILLQGILQLYTGGNAIFGIPTEFGNFGSIQIGGLPTPFILLILMALLVWYLLMHTPGGRQLEAIGSNEKAARLVGIPTDRLIAVSFLGSALVASIAGILLTSRQGGADPTAAISYLFPSLAAVFLGATTIRPGRYNVWGTIIGIFVVAVGINGLVFLGAASWVTQVFNGGALIIAVTVSTLMGRRREHQAVKKLIASSTAVSEPLVTSTP